MFNIIGADGKQYGPVSLDQLRSWLSQGRINAQTRIQAVGTEEWRPAREVPALAILFQNSGEAQSKTAPPVLMAAGKDQRRKRMAVASFVLGLCSFVLCLSFITALPAIILGHVARKRAARSPEQFSGRGFAIAGIVLGYGSILLTLVMAGLIIPAVSRSPQRSLSRRSPIPMPTDCQNNLRQIGLAMKVWALERNDQYPFNVSTNSGGSLELCSRGLDGFETDPVPHLRVISNELSSTAFLVCPRDSGKHAAANFASLTRENVSYQLRTGANINGDNPQEILAVCPVHGNVLYCDGNVRAKPKH